MLDRWGGRATILVGLLLSSFSIIALPLTGLITVGQGPLLVMLIVLGGLGIGVVWTNCDAVISQLARSGQLSTSLGTAGSFKEIGDMLGPLTIGALSEAVGVAAGFIACGILGLGGTMLLLRREARGAVTTTVARTRRE